MLAAARRAHENGDYAAARSLYSELIQRVAEGPVVWEARWRLGQAYLDDDAPIEGYVALELARQRAPSSALPAQVDFWLAEGRARAGDAVGAVAAYERYLAKDSALAGEVHLRMGRALAGDGQDEAAEAEFKQALALAPDNFVRFAAQEELATLYQARGDLPAALVQLDAILGRSQFDRYRAELQELAGRWLADAGQLDPALERYRQAVAADETSPGALAASTALAEAGQPLDALTTARILLGNRLYSEGIAALRGYLDAAPDHPPELQAQLAEAYFSQRDYPQALVEWQRLLDAFPDYVERAYILTRMAVAHSRLGEGDAARDFYRQAGTPAALLEAARVAERRDDCHTAALEYLDLARQHPASVEAGEALYRGGLCQYRNGERQASQASWQRVLDDHPAHTYAHAARFWAGKAALEAGDLTAAASLWLPLQAQAADSYYTARAAELAAGRPELAAVQAQWALALPATDDPARLQADAQAWLAGWGAPAGVKLDPARLTELPAALAADPQLARAEAYLAADLRAEALREFSDLRTRYRNDPLALYALALRLRDLGVYGNATLAALRVGELGPGGLWAAPPFIQRLAYPTYYADLVEAEAAARGLDPLLIYALIRQESFFERGARSSAAAQGLMQVIPDTAEWIAGALRWPNFQDDDIYKPYVNVKFGVYYLAAALDMLEDNPYAALAGYNAGPGNARAWLDQEPGDDPDLFIERITLSEPRLYVRRVMAFYQAYQRLYPTMSTP